MDDSRLQVVVVLPGGHGKQGISQIRLAAGPLPGPDLVEAFSADAAAEMSMELLRFDLACFSNASTGSLIDGDCKRMLICLLRT